MTQYRSNVENYAGNFSSVAIAPPGEATFYTQTHYRGFSLCLKPAGGGGWPSHWTIDISDLGVEPGRIKSMKLGCDSPNVHYSSPMSALNLKIIN